MLRKYLLLIILLCVPAVAVHAQNASLGNGLSAAAIGRGGAIVTSVGSPLDAVEGNPANLAGIAGPALDLAAVGVFASGRFQNAANSDGRLNGVAGAMPYGAFAAPVGHGPWVASVAFTPDLLMRANWRYVDAPGTAGASYGLQNQEDEIIALRSSVGVGRSFGTRWSAGVTLGAVYNRNNLNAPYIFQQQPQLAGLKVLLNLQTEGVGWNGSAGFQWRPSTRLSVGVAWKSGTTITTHGTASGTASAQFSALGISADPTFHYESMVSNHLPQVADAGFSWQQNPHLRWTAEADFIAWGQAFQQLPVKLTQGTNATINSVAGSTTLVDAVPLHWNNQGAVHVGVESPVGEHWTVRGGYSYMSNPVPAATLIPLTAAIMQNGVAAGAGWTGGHWHVDAAYQAQLPTMQSVSKSSLLAGEYDNSSVRLMMQSVTVSGQVRF